MTTGTGSKQRWTPFADEVIEALYATKGARACQALLPGRTVMAIQQRAFKLRVRLQEAGPAEESPWPRDDMELACDLALRSLRVCEPAQNLTWILSEAA